MKKTPYICFIVAAVSIVGCIPSEKLTEKEIDGYWFLHADTWPDAQRQPLKLAGKTLPAKWIFRQDPSLIWSTVSMVRAIDKLEAGTEVFDISISPTHADMLVSILKETRVTIEDLREIADPATNKSPERWSAVVASALVSVEKIARLSTSQERHEMTGETGEPLGWSAGPMLQMVTAYLNERTGGDLLAGMGENQAGQLREALVQMVLRLSFAAAGRQDPPELRAYVVDVMRGSNKPELLEKILGDVLRKNLDKAPPAKPGNRLSSLIGTAFSVAPKALGMLETFVSQWDKMDAIELEFRRDGGKPVVSVVIKIQPGKELRLDKQFFMQPALVFRGGTRIIIQPHATQTAETVVLFEPLEGGQAELRFEGVLYGMVRLLALPLSNAALREVRVSTESHAGQKLTSVTILMEATDGSRDTRRIMTVQDVRDTQIDRSAFAITKQTTKTEQIFNYLTPTRRYMYRRVKTPDSEQE